MSDTHFVPYDSPGRGRAQAVCGRFVHRLFDHSPQPTCPECIAAQAQYEALDLGPSDPPPVVKAAR